MPIFCRYPQASPTLSSALPAQHQEQHVALELVIEGIQGLAADGQVTGKDLAQQQWERLNQREASQEVL